jgi:flagellar protein FliS
MAGVNFEAGDLAKNLYSLYEYIHYLLIQANIQKEAKPAEEALVMVGELRETWTQMLKERKSHFQQPI